MKYTKYLAILAAAFMMGSCSDDFFWTRNLQKMHQKTKLKICLIKDPTAIQAYIQDITKYVFSGSTAKS